MVEYDGDNIVELMSKFRSIVNSNCVMKGIAKEKVIVMI